MSSPGTVTVRINSPTQRHVCSPLGYGGVSYVARILGCSVRTIERGLKELDHLENDPAAGRVRRPGAGRKKRLNLSRLKRRT